MSKSVLMSIRPEWCEMITNGKKTIEVRKTRPKLETPFKCYIYCTLSGCNEFFRETLKGEIAEWNRGGWANKKGCVIGEFVCSRLYYIEADVDMFGGKHLYNTVFLQNSICMSNEELFQYLYKGKGKKNGGWAWSIRDLVIYDIPKELSEFTRLRNTKFGLEPVSLVRPPQSWCYVEEPEGE